MSDLIKEVRANPQALAAVWADDDVLAELLASILEQPDTYDELRGLVFSWVRSVRDIRCLLRLADEDGAVMFLDDFVLDRAARIEVISALVASATTCNIFPQRGSWIGHAMFARGASMLNSHPATRFEIAELIPIGVDADRASARALLSSAMEAGQLTDHASAEVERLFPDDRSRPRR